jgi:hypothetical protein
MLRASARADLETWKGGMEVLPVVTGGSHVIA